MTDDGDSTEIRGMAENLVDTLLDAAGSEGDDGMVTFPNRALMEEVAEDWILSHIVDGGLYEAALS